MRNCREVCSRKNLKHICLDSMALRDSISEAFDNYVIKQQFYRQKYIVLAFVYI